ncbi:unnamed protein product [Adineta ricciae]|uniref:Uncharacterized protein n=1 Tax=Adineta ricciae TaxID=249248 RepID=A0A815X4J5_ADIRI|nr:unnamed protein product [Adineta ricciae]
MCERTKFLLMIILEIPAILLSIVILVYFVLDRQARSKLKNHGWIVLLGELRFVPLYFYELPEPMSVTNIVTKKPMPILSSSP